MPPENVLCDHSKPDNSLDDQADHQKFERNQRRQGDRPRETANSAPKRAWGFITAASWMPAGVEASILGAPRGYTTTWNSSAILGPFCPCVASASPLPSRRLGALGSNSLFIYLIDHLRRTTPVR